LRKIGISTLSIWEHELKESSDLNKAVNKIQKRIRKLLAEETR
jgi:G:T-mismatch repair DNA endonuclease (very short patch repair protein)